MMIHIQDDPKSFLWLINGNGRDRLRPSQQDTKSRRILPPTPEANSQDQDQDKDNNDSKGNDQLGLSLTLQSSSSSMSKKDGEEDASDEGLQNKLQMKSIMNHAAASASPPNRKARVSVRARCETATVSSINHH